jgi:carbamoyltransferase
MTAILGISAYYHDSASALVVDGQIVAAAQEERFSRVKHDARLPSQAIAYCLSEAGLAAGDLDYVAFYEKPLTKFERILETFIAHAPAGCGEFQRAIPQWLEEKLRIRGRVAAELGGKRRAPLVFLDHHESHAASAFFPSPFDEAAILTLDGVGEWTTTALGVGRGNRIELTHHQKFPHSLGLLYSAFTAYCGFEVNDGEYKLMGLAPYGRPVYAQAIREHLIDLKPDGSFRLNTEFFSFGYAARMTNRKFDGLFGGPPRPPEVTIDQRHADLAASVQSVLSDAVLRIAAELHRRTRQENLVIAGGVALNCVANEALLRSGPFKRLWIQPAAGDAGGALGAALFVWHQLLKQPRQAAVSDRQNGSLLGPAFSSADVRKFLDWGGVHYLHITDRAELDRRVAQMLVDGKVAGWFQGRMEFGPRALGARSILADGRRADMQSVLNQKIKFREGFRPFAPAVLSEHAEEWFDLPGGQESPYMLLTAPVREPERRELSATEQQIMQSDPDFCRRAAVVRSSIPAATHVDFSARVQTVDAAQFPRLHALLTEFHRQTTCPVLVNTSFNVRGEPIVCTPEDAFRCFSASGLDVLVIEDCIIEKPVGSIASRLSGQTARTSFWPFEPMDRQLREFALIGGLLLAAVGIWRAAIRSNARWSAALVVAGLAVAVAGLAWPRLFKIVFVAWMTLVYPIARIVSIVLLAIVFYALITPIALFFRWRGRDALDRAIREGQESYWRDKPPAAGPGQYLKQF